MDWNAKTAASDNLIVPLTIESFRAGHEYARLCLGANLKKQYYKNADMDFRALDPSCLRMAGMPVYTALRKVAGRWKEVYDQDKHFQLVGRVPTSPAWSVDPEQPSHILKTVIEADIELEFYDFLKAVFDRYMESHDVVLEIFGKSRVAPGYPKEENGINVYGHVNFDITRFEALYIVPKGGPSGSMYFS